MNTPNKQAELEKRKIEEELQKAIKEHPDNCEYCRGIETGKAQTLADVMKIIDSIEVDYPDDDGLPFEQTAEEFRKELKAKLQEQTKWTMKHT